MIRPYQPSDRPDVERICVETGARGRLERMFVDKELFAGLWLSPFLDVEPESAFVAVVDGEVVGYLVGAVGPRFQLRAFARLLPLAVRLAWRWASGGYRSHAPSRRFARWFLFRSWRELPATPSRGCQFHFNVSERARGGRGLGQALMAAFFAHARASGHGCFHITVFVSAGKRTLDAYERNGFRTLDVKRSTLFDEPTNVASLGRAIPPDGRIVRESRPERPELSIVIPAHNEELHLGRLLESLAQQVHQGFEVVVACDRCTDGTEALARARGARVVVGQWGSAAGARNAGLAEAQGRAILLLDADTVCARELVWSVLHEVRSGAAYGGPRLVPEAAYPAYVCWVWAQNLISRLLRIHYGTALFATREALERAGVYEPSLRWGEDVELTLRLRQVGRWRWLRTGVVYSQRKFQGGPTREVFRRLGMALGALVPVWRRSRRA